MTMDESYSPRHRADVPVDSPAPAVVPRHRADRLLERLGAAAFSIEDAFNITRIDDMPAVIR